MSPPTRQRLGSRPDAAGRPETETHYFYNMFYEGGGFLSHRPGSGNPAPGRSGRQGPAAMAANCFRYFENWHLHDLVEALNDHDLPLLHWHPNSHAAECGNQGKERGEQGQQRVPKAGRASSTGADVFKSIPWSNHTHWIVTNQQA